MANINLSHIRFVIFSYLLFGLGWLNARVFKPLPGKVDNVTSRLLEIIDEQEKRIVSVLSYKLEL